MTGEDEALSPTEPSWGKVGKSSMCSHSKMLPHPATDKQAWSCLGLGAHLDHERYSSGQAHL